MIPFFHKLLNIGIAYRAVIFQSIARISSPGRYSLISENSTPWPLKSEM
ncbi:MAG TPA: hypothetical protein PLY78_08795 [Methanospirillum sp.]|nr:hypothetical protein [Methanospirillum sp.]